jgi:hypothetical protein
MVLSILREMGYSSIQFFFINKNLNIIKYKSGKVKAQVLENPDFELKIFRY